MKTLWLFAAGMRRAASTLQYHLAREVVEHVGGIGIGWITWQKFWDAYSEYDREYPIVVLKCHAFLPEHVSFVGNLFGEKRAKALYIHRDIRDVAASLTQMKPSIIDGYNWEYIIQLEIPAILREYELWTSLPKDQIIVQKYTWRIMEMLDDILINTDEILGRRYPLRGLDERIEIVGRHTTDAHLALINEQEYTESGWNAESLLWRNHINDGAVGKYKTVLTPEQIAQVEGVAGDWLKARGYMT